MQGAHAISTQINLRLLTQWSKWLSVTVSDTLFIQMFQSLGAIYTHRNLIPTSFALSQSISLRVFYFPECGWYETGVVILWSPDRHQLFQCMQTPTERFKSLKKREIRAHEEIDEPAFRFIVLECSLQTAFHLSRSDWEDHRSP